MIDRELCVPRSWIEDPDRCDVAGIPADVEFTKPALAARILIRAIEAGTPARWATGDEGYGADPTLRAQLEALGHRHGLGYVLTIGCDRRVCTHGGRMRPDDIAAALPAHCWQRYSAGAGATGELAYYRCYSPAPVPLTELVRVAGARWTVEETFQAGKGLTGLDAHQVRRWTSWRWWTLIAMAAHALLAVLAAAERAQNPAPDGLIALTCNEISRLFNRLITEPTRRLVDPLTWTNWRTRHQHRARTSHYRRRPQT